jgi:hypothetical protein
MGLPSFQDAYRKRGFFGESGSERQASGSASNNQEIVLSRRKRFCGLQNIGLWGVRHIDVKYRQTSK